VSQAEVPVGHEASHFLVTGHYQLDLVTVVIPRVEKAQHAMACDANDVVDALLDQAVK
jgi:hypothetical protein